MMFGKVRADLASNAAVYTVPSSISEATNPSARPLPNLLSALTTVSISACTACALFICVVGGEPFHCDALDVLLAQPSTGHAVLSYASEVPPNYILEPSDSRRQVECNPAPCPMPPTRSSLGSNRLF